MGSVLFLAAWGVLMGTLQPSPFVQYSTHTQVTGPWAYIKHLTSGDRLPFTAAYFGSIALTLYFAIGVS